MPYRALHPCRLPIICLWLLLSTLASASAQGYNAAAGLRIGTGAGLSYAQRIGPTFSLEVLAQNRFGTDAFTVALIGRRHVALGLKRVNFYVGAGVHKGWGYEDDERSRRGNPLGLTGQGGAEVTLGRTNVAFDFLPQVHLSGRVVPFSFGSAVSLRYVIARRRSGIRVRYPWESKDEQRERIKDKKKRKRAKEKAKRRGEHTPFLERIGLKREAGERD